MQVWSVGCEDPLKEEMATLSSILAWEILWTKEPCGLQSMGEQKCQTWLSTHTHTQHIFIYMKNDITPYTCIWLYNQLLLDFCSNFSPRLILLLFTIYSLMSVTQVTADVLEILHVCACSVTQSCSTLCNPVDCSPSKLLCPWSFLGKNFRVAFSTSGDLPDPGMEPASLASPVLAGGFLPMCPLGSPWDITLLFN